MKEARIPVAMEGWPFICLFAFLALIAAMLHAGLSALVLAALTVFCLYFFRDPERILPEGEELIVCPADGRIIQIDRELDDRFLNDEVYKVSIFMSVFDVHVNRLPFAGKVARVDYFPGKFYSANTSRGGLENEKCALTVETDGHGSYTVIQVAGLIARRIVCWAEPGDAIGRGSRFGLIRFGSRVDVLLPLNVQMEVVVGQQVRAGETVLGTFH